MRLTSCLALAVSSFIITATAAPKQLSGIYPHLTMFNDENECGTGAVVPWADRLWVITYAPHKPKGSSDKLYEITPDLKLTIRPESIGGTPANRMIHKESNQLFIGPYAIDAKRNVRAIPYSQMFGRHTGLARHLTNPAEKILFATMEEGIYEVDVKTLKSTELWGDEQTKKSPRKANLPGYHGKGFYSGQGVYVYANNGEHGTAAKTRPEIPSGVLAEWDGKSDAWKIVRRNQFTEVTGPGGIHGNSNPATDAIWAVGWDYKSLIMGVRDAQTGWSFFRLPKGSHSYDGAHGWNTEWPRIREIGEGDYLMTMHGTFWKFPKTFTANTSAGIAPRSNYLKVIGDFCRWNDQIVFGCDDTAKAEFLNKRKAKGEIAAPQSQSNLWFVNPDQLDHFGPLIGRGSVWEKEAVNANTPSDPYLFSGYDQRGLHLTHDAKETVTFTLEVDKKGDGTWSKLRDIQAEPNKPVFTEISPQETGVWVRITSDKDLPNATAEFTYRNNDTRTAEADAIFNGLAEQGKPLTGGLVRARDGNKRSLSFAAVDQNGKDIGYYEMGADLTLKLTDDPKTHSFTKAHTKIPTAALGIDQASVIYTDEQGKRWRLPKGEIDEKHPLGSSRIAREVATERDLLNANGTFYELPARNAGGISKLRAISTHNRNVHDFCSYRGLLIISGISTEKTDNKHIITSDDGKTALWAGTIDDIWKLGKPRGKGGPWFGTSVKSGQASDPYLMTGYDKKTLQLRSNKNSKVTAQIDITGTGHWVDYKTFELETNHLIGHEFPQAFQAYWIRFVSDQDATVTAQLIYR
ncbi:hypothetical protein NT6N_18800 [Oceaniferula spumae]|uniref:Uncharacterized protein n=1 Tax=Oceaniferula spumae TaxID=2979115 RepID=A0AAT9FLJ7_9BACT